MQVYPLFNLQNIQSQRGNALFLILIAVALFAALSYAITQSGRGGGAMDQETDTIIAAQLIQIAADLRAAATRMVLTGTPVASVKLHTGISAEEACGGSDSTCLFSPEGGGAVVPSPPTSAFITYDPTVSVSYAEINETIKFPAIVEGVGTTARDLIFAFAGLREDVCRAINKGLGITGIPVQDNAWDDNLPAITFTAAANEESACVDISILSPTPYVFYQVLVAQ